MQDAKKPATPDHPREGPVEAARRHRAARQHFVEAGRGRWHGGGHPMTRAGCRLAFAALFGAFALAGCEPKTPKPEADVSAATPGDALPGVNPHDENKPPASDRPGAVAIGAVEAGQSSGGDAAAHPAPTAGDGIASGAASAGK